MNNSFQNFLSGFIQMNEEEINLLANACNTIQFKKGEVFISEGEVSNKIGFLISGVSRVYHLANDKEFTSYFNFPQRNRLVASFESFLTGKPSRETIHFLQDAELVIISRDSLTQLYQQSLKFSELGRKLAEYNYVLAMHRIYSLQHDTAQERYLKLLDIYPELVNLVPHHYIASYLGVTAESLSRIRKELAR